MECYEKCILSNAGTAATFTITDAKLYVPIVTLRTEDNVTDENSYRRYFVPRIKIQNYNIEIDGRTFYDQPINDSIKQYDEARKISTGKGDDYTTGCLLDFAYFEKNYKIIAADLSKQKALDVDSRAI